MAQQLSQQDIRNLRRCLTAARMNIRLAWAGALDEAAQRQLVLAEEQIGIAEGIAGSETDAVQPWEATT